MRQELEQELADKLEESFRGFSPKSMIIKILGQEMWDSVVNGYIDQTMSNNEADEELPPQGV